MKPSIKKLLLFGSTAPYSGALLALDFVGSRSNGQPYYMLNGVNYPLVSGVPGWTYTGGTAAGTGSYAARADGSLQFFPSYTNLLLQSQTFNVSPWGFATGGSATANSVTAPDGTLTADTITAGTVAFAGGVGQSFTYISGVTYTVSVYVKKANWRYVGIRINTSIYGASEKVPYYDFDTDTLSSNGVSGASITRTLLANGWVRLSMTYIATVSTGSTAQIWITQSDGSTSATTAGTEQVYAWGAQLELGSTASTYIPTTTAAVTVATPRITDAGYWAEEARTNSIPNTSTTGAVVGVIGSGGALPTGWFTTAPSGLTYEVVSIGTGAYGPYVDVRLSGTNTSGGTGFPGVGFSGKTTIAASTGQTWSGSFYVSLVAGSTSGVTSFIANNIETNTGGSVVTAGSTSYTPISTVTRQIVSRTLNGGASTAFTYLASSQQVATGATMDFTLRLSTPQLELGSFATSPIPTTSVAVTRAADVGYVSGLVVPMSAVTMLTNSLIGPAMSNAGRIGNLSDGTNNMMATAFGGTNQGSAVAQGVSLAAISSAQTAGQIGRVAVKLEGTSLTASGIGEAATSVAGTYSGASTATRLYVGNTTASDRPSNTAIRRVVIYPRAFGNSELQAITTAGAY